MSEAARDWIGQVPEHWKIAKLRHLSTIHRGASPRPIDDSKYFDEIGEYGWVRISDVTASQKYLLTTEQRLSELGSSLSVKLGPGRLVLSIAATVGVPILTAIKCCIHDGFVTFDRLQLNPEYLYYMLLSVAPFGGLGKLGTQLNLNTNIVGDIRVPVPPLDEQRMIADFLDRETARIDQLIGKTKLLLRLAGEDQSAAIHSLVTGKIGHNDYKDFGCPWFGHMPSHWQTVELRRLIKPGTSITYGIVQAGPEVEGGIPYIRTSDMAGDKLPPGGYARTSPEIDRSYRRSKVHTGDLVVAIRATVGKVLPVPEYLDGANLTQGTAKISPASSIDPEFLLAVLQGKGAQQRFDSLAKGATFREITLDMLRRFPVPVPPLNEQREIVNRVRELADAHHRLRDLINAAIDKLVEYREVVISAAVTGQIDVRTYRPQEAAVLCQ